MTDDVTEGDSDEAVRVWLVGREYTDKGLVTLTYATPDGGRVFVQQRSAANLGEVTAARTVATDRLDPAEANERERFAQEAERMAGSHDPEDAV